MLGLREYTITARGGYWPSEEFLILDPSSGKSIAIVREEPWPEVLERPWPDGVKGRPWLLRLLGVGRSPSQSRTVVRRCDDGSPLVRLHYRELLITRKVYIFDHEDHRIGYCRWSLKGGLADAFHIIRVDHQPLAEVHATAAGAYCVTEVTNGMEWGGINVSRDGVSAKVAFTCRVSLNETAVDREHAGEFLLVAALVLIRLP